MKYKVALSIMFGMVVLLIIWGIASFNASDGSTAIFGLQDYREKLKFDDGNEEDYQKKLKSDGGTQSLKQKCGVSVTCQPGHFVFRIRSGAANTVGPKICFDGKIIMSEAHNNVGGGLNMVVVNGKTGVLENARSLSGSSQEVLAFLHDIKPGMIVLVASYNDPSERMTDEIKNVFSGMGSTKAKSIKYRDSWVFASRTGMEHSLHFEQINVSDEANNLYDGWPAMAEVEGCFSSVVGQPSMDGV